MIGKCHHNSSHTCLAAAKRVEAARSTVNGGSGIRDGRYIISTSGINSETFFEIHPKSLLKITMRPSGCLWWPQRASQAHHQGLRYAYNVTPIFRNLTPEGTLYFITYLVSPSGKCHWDEFHVLHRWRYLLAILTINVRNILAINRKKLP